MLPRELAHVLIRSFKLYSRGHSTSNKQLQASLTHAVKFGE